MTAKVRTIAVVVLAGAIALMGWLPQARAAQWWKLAWTLEVTVTPPKRVTVKEAGGSVLYTYLTYEISNRGLRDVDVVPLVTLTTDTLKVYHNQTQPMVKAMAERRERAALRTGVEMMGPIKVGESRRGVVIFRDIDLKAKRWHLYIAGLSGEYVLQLIPGRAEPLILHKTYHVEYRNRGDEFEPHDDEIEFVKKEWTYRTAGPTEAPAATKD
jgi:hypothetical protein